jgi:PAS domain S-box-containing protein
MAPNTAIAFVLLGLALVVFRKEWPWTRVFARAAGVLVLVVACCRLYEFASGADLHVDAWLLNTSGERFGLAPVGEMAFPTAVGFLLACIALLLHIGGRRERATQTWCIALGAVVSFLGATFALGYAYGKPLLYGGHVIPMALNTAAAFTLLGTALLLVTAAHDVAARRAAEADRRRTQQFLDSIVENIPNMVFVKDARELRFVLFNRAGEELLGHRRDELIGKNDFDFFPREQADFFTAKDRETLEAGALVDITDEPITTRDGEARILHTKKLPLQDEFGRPRYLLGISEDITERKHTEMQIMELSRDLQLRATQLATANSELEAFAYSVSHDLRAPLRHIVGFGSLLKKSMSGALDEKSGEHLATMIESAERMGRLIDDLLAFSRAGRTDLTKSAVDLNAVVEEVRRQMREEFKDRDVAWRIGMLPTVFGDQNLLHQVVVNLLGNAVKFTRLREHAEIEVGCVDGGSAEAVIFVRDNGAGFDMKYSDKLFGVFQRLHSANEFEGTGIGLANVQRIVAKHGGRTWAEGSIGGGATFYFSIPNEQGVTKHEHHQTHTAR